MRTDTPLSDCKTWVHASNTRGCQYCAEGAVAPGIPQGGVRAGGARFENKTAFIIAGQNYKLCYTAIEFWFVSVFKTIPTEATTTMKDMIPNAADSAMSRGAIAQAAGVWSESSMLYNVDTRPTRTSTI